MKKQLAILLLLLAPTALLAAGGGGTLEKAPARLDDKASLQNGYKYFTNYCMGCHAVGFSRYNRVAKDLDIPEQLVMDNAVFTRDEKGDKSKIGSLMTIAMTADYASEAFGGAVPPDLSLTARSRGADWIYSYLKSFYVDESRPMGVNNVTFPNVGMPNVLWELQGTQELLHEDDNHGEAKAEKEHGEHSAHGDSNTNPYGLTLTHEGKLSPEEYDKVVADITNFMVYVAEPFQLKRKRIGVYVILFLMLLAGFTYLLKKEYWKDIH